MGILAWYPLTGDTLDVSGNGYVVTGSPTINNYGKIGKTYDFSSNYLTMDYRGQGLSLKYNNSICFWIKLKALPASGSRFGVFETAYGAEWAVNVASDGSLQLYYGTSGAETTPYTSTSSNFGLVTNTWYHVAIVRNINNNTIEWYKNGNLLQQTALEYIPAESSTSLKIGRSYTGNLNGYLNDFRIYDHALTRKEVYEIAKAKILHYSFDDPEEPTKNLWVGNTYSWNNGYATATRNVLDIAPLESGFEVAKIEANTLGVFGKCILWTTPIVPVVGDKYTHSAWIYLKEGTYCTIGQHWNPWIDSPPIYIPKMVWTRVSFTTTIADTSHLSIANQYGTDGVIYVCMPQYEKKEYATSFVYGERFADILDYSGYNNHQAIDLAYSPKWISDSPRGLGAYEFFTSSKINTPLAITSDLFAQNSSSFTLMAWVKPLEAVYDASYAMLVGGTNNSGFGIMCYQSLEPFAYFRNINGTYQTSSGGMFLNEWHHLAMRVDKGLMSMAFYVNGVRVGSPVSITNGSFSTNSTFSINEEQYAFASAGLTATRHFAIDDVKIYMNAFTDAQILAEFQAIGSLDHQGNIFGDFNIRENNFDLINDALSAKTFSNGLTAYTQSNCQVSLTDYGYRIYRPPNLIYPDAGNTMWGGLKIQPFSISPNILQKGRKYRIVFTVTGKTSNGIGAMYFTNQMGWGGGGLSPSPTVISSNGLPANFVGTTDLYYEFEINDDIYKVCTTSYSGFIAGQTYLSYRDLAWGFQYTSTGAMGTDLYLTNFRLWDITGEEKVSLSESGILYANEISEIGVTDGLIAHYPLNGDTEDYSGNNFHGTNHGSSIVGGLRGICYSFDGIDDYVNISGYGLDHPSSYKGGATFSCWVKTTIASGIARFVCGFHYLSINAQGKLQNMVYNSATQANYWLYGNTVINTGNWVNVVFTIEKGIGVKYYVNGVLDASYEDSGIDIISYLSNSAFGAIYNGFFEGLMEDLRIYDRALTPEEIAINYDIYNPTGSQMKITKDCFYVKGQIKEGY